MITYLPFFAICDIHTTIYKNPLYTMLMKEYTMLFYASNDMSLFFIKKKMKSFIDRCPDMCHDRLIQYIITHA
jgi:hypothetical protein